MAGDSFPRSPVVVITGGTKGLGLGMAQAFLRHDCHVVVNGRDPERLAQAVAVLAGEAGGDRVLGRAGDVADADEAQALWQAAVERFQGVDIWINNAAIGSIEQDFWEHDPATIRSLIETNLLGTLYGTRVAARGMLAQGHGQIFNLEGWGSGNERRPGSALYGTSKAAVSYFTRSLVAELRGTPVRLGRINPGIVVTDLLALSIRPGQEARIARFIDLFGDRVETVAPVLAARVLANRRHGVRIAWLTPRRVLGRLLSAPFRRRRVMER
ncbi:SDR family oxidoreductase [Thiococcus pfennigii]|uniref:SDR family oxidoreductase n=1 Tax=Thiococcus pfennigii TaxID=1057 RepID=UPI001905A92C|nr:SDR family NAD(P)-dependent oxidoreductase [Thiococcus pfennigii]MBK1730320.1 short-chain dehydrogenase [Thiococcus pfennigii]